VDVLALSLVVLGVGFLVANARLILEYLTYRRRRRAALFVWSSPKPPYYGTALALGVILGVLVIYKVIYLRRQAFGEAMMFLYYGYLVPLTLTIRRGFYEDGVWTDAGFIPYREIGGISWRETEHEATLIVISRLRNLARRLAVPLDHYGAARRFLHDKIKQHDIQFTGTGLALDQHDARDDV
jgi:hypothetical protein